MEMLGDLPAPGVLGPHGDRTIASPSFFKLPLLQLARKSSHDCAAHTENGIGMLAHRWVTSTAGDCFYTRVAD